MKLNENKFTVRLAAVDALPVLFFGIACVVLGIKLRSGTFFVGAIFCLLAGVGKLIWKFLIALAGKDVKLLGAQLRCLMPTGFIVMVIGAATSDHSLVPSLVHAAVRMPAVVFFAAAICGIAGMIVCACRYGRYDARGN